MPSRLKGSSWQVAEKTLIWFPLLSETVHIVFPEDQSVVHGTGAQLRIKVPVTDGFSETFQASCLIFGVARHASPPGQSVFVIEQPVHCEVLCSVMVGTLREPQEMIDATPNTAGRC